MAPNSQMPQALPTITDATPDAEVLRWLLRVPDLGDRLMLGAHALYQQLMASPYAPHDLFRDEWYAHRNGFGATVRPPGMNVNSAADHELQIRRIRKAAAARAHFEAYFRMPREEVGKRAQEHKAGVVAAMHERTATHMSTHQPASTFNAGLAVQQLGQRGVCLSVAHDGSLMASPAGLLTAADRKVLVTHEAAMKAFLMSAERVA